MGRAHQPLAAERPVAVEDVEGAHGPGHVERPGAHDDLVPAVPVDVADGRRRVDGRRGTARPMPGQGRAVGVVGVELAVLAADDDVVAAVVVDVADRRRTPGELGRRRGGLPSQRRRGGGRGGGGVEVDGAGRGQQRHQYETGWAEPHAGGLLDEGYVLRRVIGTPIADLKGRDAERALEKPDFERPCARFWAVDALSAATATLANEVLAEAGRVAAGPGFPAGYLARVRTSAARLAVTQGGGDDVRSAALLLEQQAAIDVEAPVASRALPQRLLKQVVRKLIGWYVRFLGHQVGVLGQAAA